MGGKQTRNCPRYLAVAIQSLIQPLAVDCIPHRCSKWYTHWWDTDVCNINGTHTGGTLMGNGTHTGGTLMKKNTGWTVGERLYVYTLSWLQLIYSLVFLFSLSLSLSLHLLCTHTLYLTHMQANISLPHSNCMHTSTHTHIHTNSLSLTHTHTHTHTHTQTLSLSLSLSHTHTQTPFHTHTVHIVPSVSFLHQKGGRQ